MTLSSIITDAGSIVTAIGTTYTSLSENFGAILLIPVTIMLTKVIVGMVKGILLFRGRRRR